jgi:hypothetical protein
MYGAVNTAATQERRVRSIYDGLDGEVCYVATNGAELSRH